jgi:hypothetical protein
MPQPLILTISTVLGRNLGKIRLMLHCFRPVAMRWYRSRICSFSLSFEFTAAQSKPSIKEYNTYIQIFI